MVVFQAVGDAVHGHILLVVHPIRVFDGVEDLIPIFTLKAVVVLILDVHDELNVAVLSASRDGFYLLNWNSTLNAGVLQVVQSHVGQQENTCLSQGPSVVLDDLAREDDLLAISELCGNGLVFFAAFLVFEGFLRYT